MKIGIVTGGGDCPGLNAVIRAVAKTAAKRGWETSAFSAAMMACCHRRISACGLQGA